MKYDFTLREFIAAMRKNGLPQTAGRTFSDYYDVRNGSSCALGQAYWNIMGQPNIIDWRHETRFWNALNNAWDDYHGDASVFPTTATIDYNDGRRLPVAMIADRIEEDFHDDLDFRFQFEVPDSSDQPNAVPTT